MEEGYESYPQEVQQINPNESSETQKAIENSIIQEERISNFISQTSPVLL